MKNRVILSLCCAILFGVISLSSPMAYADELSGGDSGDHTTNSQPESPEVPDQPEPETPDTSDPDDNTGNTEDGSNTGPGNEHLPGDDLSGSTSSGKPNIPTDINQGTVRPSTGGTPATPSTQPGSSTNFPSITLPILPKPTGNSSASDIQLPVLIHSNSSQSSIEPAYDASSSSILPDASSAEGSKIADSDNSLIRATSTLAANSSTSQLRGLVWFIAAIAVSIIGLSVIGSFLIVRYGRSSS